MDTELLKRNMAVTFDALTGETIEREMTDEEIAALPEPTDLPNPE